MVWKMLRSVPGGALSRIDLWLLNDFRSLPPIKHARKLSRKKRYRIACEMLAKYKLCRVKHGYDHFDSIIKALGWANRRHWHLEDSVFRPIVESYRE